MRNETRESLFFVLNQMDRQLVQLADRREVAEIDLAKINGEIAELERRRTAIREDLESV